MQNNHRVKGEVDYCDVKSEVRSLYLDQKSKLSSIIAISSHRVHIMEPSAAGVIVM